MCRMKHAPGIRLVTRQQTQYLALFQKEHPIVSLCIICGVGYALVSLLSSVIVFLYGIALPMLRNVPILAFGYCHG